MKKKFVSLLLTGIMLFSLLPAAAYAEDGEEPLPQEGTEITEPADIEKAEDITVPEDGEEPEAADEQLALQGELAPMAADDHRVYFNYSWHNYSNFDDAWAAATAAAPYYDVMVELGRDVNTSTYLEVFYNYGHSFTLDLKGHIINRNLSQATKWGTVIWVYDEAQLTIMDSSREKTGKITGGYASNCAGGVHVESYGSLMLYDVSIYGNKSTWYGGGVYLDSHARFIMSGGSISNNWTSGDGGGVYAYEVDAQNIYESYTGGVITGALIENNRADGYGGGMCANECNLFFDSCKILNNSACRGGGIFAKGKTGIAAVGASVYDVVHQRMTNCEITGNRASDDGGGLYFESTITSGSGYDAMDAECHLTNCVIANNTSGAYGGGINVWALAYLTLDSCTITGNSCSEKGGGIYHGAGHIVFRSTSQKTLITGNVAGGAGGGLAKQNKDYYYLYISGTLQVIGNTGAEGKNDILVYGKCFRYYDVKYFSQKMDPSSLLGVYSESSKSQSLGSEGSNVARCFLVNQKEYKVRNYMEGYLERYRVYYLEQGDDPIRVADCRSKNNNRANVLGSVVTGSQTMRVDAAFADGTIRPELLELTSEVPSYCEYVGPIEIGGKTYYRYDVLSNDGSENAQPWLVEIREVPQVGKAEVTVEGTTTEGTFAACWKMAAEEAEDGKDANVKMLEHLRGAKGVFGTAGTPGFGAGGKLTVAGSGMVTLDLNGHTLSGGCAAANVNGSVLTVEKGGRLTVIDSAGDGVITGGYGVNGGGLYVASGGQAVLTGGKIADNRASQNGGGVYVQGQLTMTGGNISGNTATGNGGGVYAAATGTASLYDTVITGNSALEGPGMYLHAFAYPTTLGRGMQIRNNSATTTGGKTGDLYLYGKISTAISDYSTINVDAPNSSFRVHLSAAGTDDVKLGTYDTVTGMPGTTNPWYISTDDGAFVSYLSGDLLLKHTSLAPPVLESFSLFSSPAVINGTVVSITIPYSKRNDLSGVAQAIGSDKDMNYTTSNAVSCEFYHPEHGFLGSGEALDFTRDGEDGLELILRNAELASVSYTFRVTIAEPLDSDKNILTILKEGEAIADPPKLYLPGERVTVTAPEDDDPFVRWEEISGDYDPVTTAEDRKNATISFTMPDRDVELKAVYGTKIDQVLLSVGPVQGGTSLPAFSATEQSPPYTVVFTQWDPDDDPAAYATTYNATITVTPAGVTVYFAQDVSVKVNNEPARNYTLNDNGTLTVYYSVVTPQPDFTGFTTTTLSAVTLDRGTSFEPLALLGWIPRQASIKLSDGSSNKMANIIWAKPEDYDEHARNGTPITATGDIAAALGRMGHANPQNLPTEVGLEITFKADSEPIDPPGANLAAGTYDRPQQLRLWAVSGAAIYYTTDGTVATTDSALYEDEVIEIPGTAGTTTTTTISAIAVKDGVSSAVATFTYEVTMPPEFEVKVSTEGGIGLVGKYVSGVAVVVNAPEVPDKVFNEWPAADIADLPDARATGQRLEFTMPARDVTVTPAYLNLISGLNLSVAMPAAGAPLDGDVGVIRMPGGTATTAAAIWSPADATADYNTAYTLTTQVEKADGTIFVPHGEGVAKVNGTTAAALISDDGSYVTVTYTFEKTRRIRLDSISSPAAIEPIPYNMPASAWPLPSVVNITLEDASAATVPVSWTLPAGFQSSPVVITYNVTGAALLPGHIDPDNKNNVSISVTTVEKGSAPAPDISPAGGAFTANPTVTITPVHFTTLGGVTHEAYYECSDGSSGTLKLGGDGNVLAGVKGATLTYIVYARTVVEGASEAAGLWQSSEVAVETYTISLPASSRPDSDRQPDAGSVPEAGPGPDSGPAPEFPFIDVDADDWFYEYVKYVWENGLMNGTGSTTFDPDLTTSRAMIVTMLYRLAGSPPVEGAAPFKDVESGSYYEKAVIWAAGLGIADGYGDGNFGPDDPVTREQMATFLYGYVKTLGLGFEGLWSFPLDYTDAEKVSDWAYEALCWMTVNGVITGRPGGVLDPAGPATRAETAAMFRRLCTILATP